MTRQSEYVAPYILRAYVWELLQRNLDFTDDDYDIDSDGKGYIPIVPLGEEPELENFDKAYIVYGFAESPVTNSRWMGNLVLAVYSTNFRRLSEVTNVISQAFESDFTVNEVNKFSSLTPGYLGIRFSNIQPSIVEGGAPEESSGGRMSAVVNLRYEYFQEYVPETEFAQWNGTTYVAKP